MLFSGYLLWGRTHYRALAAASFLALLGCHRKAPCLLSTDKPWVAVGAGCVPLLSRGVFSDESVKVELSLEGFVLGLLEVDWNDFIHEAFEIVYLEGFPTVYPRNNFGIALVLVYGFEHLVELPGKGQLGGG